MNKDGDGRDCRCRNGLTRRGFLKAAGVGATAAASGSLGGTTGADGQRKETDTGADADNMTRATLHINGRRHTVLVEPRWSLLFVLRDRLGLTGAKPGCERGECGACTVLLDGRPRYACLTLALEAEGVEVTTVEGLMDGEDLGPVQQAFLENDAFQCGYCTPGQIMAAEGLLRSSKEPATEEIRVAMSGNLCRCGAYPNIVKAVRRASALNRGAGGEP